MKIFRSTYKKKKKHEQPVHCFSLPVPFLDTSDDGLLSDHRILHELKRCFQIAFSDRIQPEQPTCTHCNRINKSGNQTSQNSFTRGEKKKSYTSVKYVQSVKFPVKSPTSIFPISPALCWVTVGSPSALNSQRQQQPADVLTHAKACKAREQRGIRIAQLRDRKLSLPTFLNTALTFDRRLIAQRFGQSGVIKSSVWLQKFLPGAGLFL